MLASVGSGLGPMAISSGLHVRPIVYSLVRMIQMLPVCLAMYRFQTGHRFGPLLVSPNKMVDECVGKRAFD